MPDGDREVPESPIIRVGRNRFLFVVPSGSLRRSGFSGWDALVDTESVGHESSSGIAMCAQTVVGDLGLC